jgi:hypothetical protein
MLSLHRLSLCQVLFLSFSAGVSVCMFASLGKTVQLDYLFAHTDAMLTLGDFD